MPPRPIRICLILHSTRSDNLGVGALTASEVAILRDISRDLGKPIEIIAMDWKDPRPPYVTGPDIRVVDLDGKTMINPFGYFAVALRSDLVVDIGAGDSFTDIYGTSRLTRIFILKFLTHLARTPLVMAPQTIGPFTKPLSRRLALLTMRLSALVVTRDALSSAASQEMGFRGPLIEASDVALRLPYDAPAAKAGVLGAPVKVGLNISGLLMNGGYTGRNEFGLQTDYPALVRDIIRHFLAHPAGCEVHLVPHVIVRDGAMALEDDLRASITLQAEFPALRLAPDFSSPSAAKSYIAGLDFFMGARMHACIAAFSSGVPVVPMAYSRKFAGLFGSLGYDHTVDCQSETNTVILHKIAVAFENRAALASEAASAAARGRARLMVYQDALRQLMARVRP
jgi:polysaccharide pyruvyl transferase WcaK-like protein